MPRLVAADIDRRALLEVLLLPVAAPMADTEFRRRPRCSVPAVRRHRRRGSRDEVPIAPRDRRTSKLAVTKACQMPFRSGCPSAIRGALYGGNWFAALCWPAIVRAAAKTTMLTARTPANTRMRRRRSGRKPPTAISHRESPPTRCTVRHPSQAEAWSAAGEAPWPPRRGVGRSRTVRQDIVAPPRGLYADVGL